MLSKGRLITLRLIWAACLVYGIGLAVVLRIVAKDPSTGGDVGTLAPIFTGLAGVLLLTAFLLPRKLLRVNVKRQARLTPGWSPHTDPLPKPVMQGLMAFHVVQFALLETVNLLGFTLGLIAQDPARHSVFLAVAVLGLFFVFPTENRIKTELRQAASA